MYLFLGQDTVVCAREILGIFDLDNTSVSALTKQFLKKAQKSGRIIEVSPGELPKSFVVCGNRERWRAYLSQISPATLKKRMEAGGLR